MGIREYTEADYHVVISLWLDCHLIESTRNASPEHLSAMRQRNKGLFLVYEDNQGKVIGTVMGGWDGWRGWIYKLAVAEEFRKSGIASQLVNEVSNRFSKMGVSIARAYIEKTNNASLSLFTKLGFERMDNFVIVTNGRQ